MKDISQVIYDESNDDCKSGHLELVKALTELSSTVCSGRS